MNDWDYMLTMKLLKQALDNPLKPIEMPIHWQQPSSITPAAIKLAVDLLEDDLADLEDYFEDLAEADYDEGRWRANREMNMRNAVRRIRAQLQVFKFKAEKEMK